MPGAPDPEAVKAAADRAERRAAGDDKPRGRGRLSSIELLPSEAEEDKIWALGELAKKEMKQADILFQLNDRLAAKGIDGISSSAFNRHSMRMARVNRRIQDGRAIIAGADFTAQDSDQQTVVITELMKTLVMELVIDRETDMTPKDTMELARAFQSIVSAQKISTDRRQKVEAEAKSRVMKAAETAIGAVAGAGVPVDKASILRKIREDVYGIQAP